MKFSLIIVPALSAIALAAPAPTLFKDKDCAHKKPYVHYADDFKGCMAYNADELKYKMSCIWYQPKVKVCKPDIHVPDKGYGYDKEKEKEKEKERQKEKEKEKKEKEEKEEKEKEEKKKKEKEEKEKKEKEEKERKEKCKYDHKYCY